MQIHQLKPFQKSRKPKRIGRGGKRGTYSGRGVKGQKSRAGRKLKPVIRELIKKYPKLRGYKFKGTSKKLISLNVEILEKNFKFNERVSPKTLIEKELIRKIKGRVPRVKILGKGELKKTLFVEKCKVSKNAKEKIEKAGGDIK